VKQVNPNTYVFQIDDKVFQIDFSPASTPGAFEVVLARKNVADYKNPFDTLNDFGKSPIVVFSTAIGIIQKWVRINQPEVVFFYGFGPDQQRAYAKMANYMSQRSDDYVVQHQNGTVAFVRRDLVQESGEMRNLVNRLEHDKMARPNKQIRKMKAVATGNTSTYPAF